nr:SDR family NAD(P)-dependent oxidoreductase [Kibdelosporangium sp. MJ126-NF4]CEL14004.1 Oxidoreductase, short-chain dehydrogenase/reductase family [Kibdelosporangium sp. MJ126-NF4]CTQ88372.1 Oxidoreductase, short-chain dehydrogenase/reductase family [Kibdelosporangium sp. MJ126-NF4]
MNVFHDKVCVITGAASGMGRSLSVELAHRGARLAISDVNTLGLAETERQCKTVGAQVKADALDVAERGAVLEYADTVAEHYGAVHYVFNNAGIATASTFEQSSFKDLEKIMDVDYWGVVNGTKAFLPHLIASGGHVVNTSSIFGLFSMPGFTAYNSAKFAVRGFTEALRMEMLAAGSPVAVTCVHPGGIKTDIARNMTQPSTGEVADFARLFDRITITSAETAARIILRGVARRSPKVLVGPDAKVLDLLVRLTGAGYQRLTTFVATRVLRGTKVLPHVLPGAHRDA